MRVTVRSLCDNNGSTACTRFPIDYLEREYGLSW